MTSLRCLISKLNKQIHKFCSLPSPNASPQAFPQVLSFRCRTASSIMDSWGAWMEQLHKMLVRSSEWHSKRTSKCRYIFFKHVTGWAGSLNTITLLKFRKQALKMQKAYKLYFSANLQLVIGKDSNGKKTLCVTCPSPHPNLKWEKQNKNRRITEDLGII